MDGLQFDIVTLRLTSLLNRRRLGAALTLLGLGASLGAAQETDAKKRKRKKKKKSPGGPCTPDCVGKVCGASDGCSGTCNQGSCPTNQTCQSGQCVPVNIYTPPCPSDRPCHEGTCTCTGGQCERDQDPDGNFCVVNPPGRPDLGLCGCITNFEVCALGEACSFCCTDLFCQLLIPDSGLVCAVPPAGAYRSRGCCVDIGSPCDGNDDCCSDRCNLTSRICECAPKDAFCRYGRGCCSNVCSIIGNASGKCA